MENTEESFDEYIKRITDNIISTNDKSIYKNNDYINNLLFKLKNVDITFGYFDLLEESKQLLPLLLNMSALIPMMDIDSFNNQFGGMTPESLSSPPLEQDDKLDIINLNMNLLNIQKIIQVYCVQQYSLLSFSSNIIYKLIKELFEQDTHNIDISDELTKLINKIKGINPEIQPQSGGSVETKYTTIIFKLLFLLLFVIPASSSFESEERTVDVLNLNRKIMQPTSNTDITTLPPPAPRQAMGGVIEFGVNPVNNNAEYIMAKKSYTINIPTDNMMAIYDEDVKEKYSGLFNSIKEILYDKDYTTAEDEIKKIVLDVNDELRKFSTNVTDNCFELMKMTSDNGIFLNLKSLDDLDFTQVKINQARQFVKNELSQTKQQALESGSEAIVDISKAKLGEGISKLGKAGSYLLKYLLTNEKQVTEQAERQVLMEDEGQTITASNDNQVVTYTKQDMAIKSANEKSTEKRLDLESSLYSEAKLYCSNGYNLQLRYKNNELGVIGDKVEYSFLIKLINLLDKNIEYQTFILNNKIKSTEYTSVDDKIKQSDAIKNNILTSLSQRLNILKTITENIADLVNFSIYSHISKLEENPTPNSLGEVKEYFDTQIIKLKELLKLLNEYFPLKTQMIDEQNKIASEESKIERRKQDILDTESQEKSVIKQREADRHAFDTQSSLNATSTYVKTLINVGTTSIQLAGEGVSELSGSAVSAAMKIPLTVAEKAADDVFKFGNNLLYKIFTNPSGWIAVSIPMICFFIYMKHLTKNIKFFLWDRNPFVMILYGGYVFIYQLIAIPSGYILKLINVALYNRGTIPLADAEAKAADAEAKAADAEAKAIAAAEEEARKAAEEEARKAAEAAAAATATESSLARLPPPPPPLQQGPLQSFSSYGMSAIQNPIGIPLRKLFAKTYTPLENEAAQGLSSLINEINEDELSNLFGLMKIQTQSQGGKKYRKTSKNKKKKTKRNIKKNNKKSKRRK